MGYELFGRLHAVFASLRADERGQGTIEYVGLIILLAVLLGGIVAAARGMTGDKSVATTIINKLKQTIGTLKVDGGGK